ncbi:hypothetical protein MHI24_20575 [Paenibacillus sp. FSL K6-1096]|uniref:hypothetical protein n=1 Tax=Paenibacillus sp. FSL K6-1096 TaxID=2921460 RepID=UPI0030EDE424
MRGFKQNIGRLCVGLMLIGVISYGEGLPVREAQAAAAAPDVSSSITVLGSPFQKAAYARNVWDMQLFGGKIYLGHGNSSNYAPSPNAGQPAFPRTKLRDEAW